MDFYDSFLAMHTPGSPLLIPNPWDAGSARVLAGLGFDALATTSGGFAATLGRLDYHINRDEALAHATSIASAVDVPVSADLENGFGDSADAVVETVNGAVDAGLAGCSIEDSTRNSGPIYDKAHAVDRIVAAVEAAYGGSRRIVLTARAENYLWGITDLDDTISRLQAFSAAGADVLYAPGLVKLDEIRTLIAAVDKPVNVLPLGGGPSIAQLAEAGAARISVGSHFANAMFAALVEAGTEFRAGESGFLDRSARGRAAIGQYFAA